MLDAFEYPTARIYAALGRDIQHRTKCLSTYLLLAFNNAVAMYSACNVPETPELSVLFDQSRNPIITIASMIREGAIKIVRVNRSRSYYSCVEGPSRRRKVLAEGIVVLIDVTRRKSRWRHREVERVAW
jgi:hypothetical protein